MANEDKQDQNPDGSLLNALESIKGLLEQSEVKLNAARESINKATPLDNNDADDIADDIDELFDDEDDFEVPELNEIVIPADVSGTGSPQIDIEVLKAFLDEMQKQLEKNMRDTLMQAVVRAETDIKKQIRAYLNQLRKMLDK